MGWCFCPLLSGLVCPALVAAKTFPPQVMPEWGRERGKSYFSGKLKGKQLSAAPVPGCEQSSPGAPAKGSLRQRATVPKGHCHPPGGSVAQAVWHSGTQEWSGWHPRGGSALSLSLSLSPHVDWTWCNIQLGSPFPRAAAWAGGTRPEVDSFLGFSPALGYHKCFLLANHSPAACEGPRPQGMKAFGDFPCFMQTRLL